MIVLTILIGFTGHVNVFNLKFGFFGILKWNLFTRKWIFFGG